MQAVITSILEAFARSAAVGDFYISPPQSVALKEKRASDLRKAWFSHTQASHYMRRHNATRAMNEALFRPQVAR